jgi:hypothetical protein
VVALLGRFKGETGEYYHLIPLVNVTNHGLEPRKWIRRSIDIYHASGIRHGPLFRDYLGQRARAGNFEERFFERLESVKERKPHLMNSTEDIREEYGVFRSFRRGATSEDVNEGVSGEAIDANNRWH